MASDWEKQLLTLRALTATTGAMHDAQLYQLKMWGKLAFAEWKAPVASVDINTKTIVYKLVKGPKHPKALANLVAGLDRSIHWLLGDDWALHVAEGSNLLYKGDRTLPNTANERKSRTKTRKS